MRTASWIFAAAMMLCGSAQAQTSPMVAAFQALCTPSLADVGGSLQAKGWVPATEADSPELTKVLAISKSAGLPMLHLHIVKHEAGAVTLYGVLSGIAVRGLKVHGCYVYDFEAKGMLPSSEIEAWLGATPTKSEGSATTDRLDQWLKPARSPGYLNVKNGFMPRGGPAHTSYGLVGASLATSQLVP
jgi:hypothetical protein